MTASLSARLAVLDPVVGFDPMRESAFTYWFDRGEQGLFVIGALLFVLGYFLERRPRPGLEPWPQGRVAASAAWMALCLAAAAAFSWSGSALDPAPWSIVRGAFALGLFVFSVHYCRVAFKKPDESARAEGDVILIKE